MSLRISPDLSLDPDYVGGGTFALLAKKGAGKTYAMRVLAEEFWTAKVPFVALDPMDAFWGLRSSADGEGEGIPVAIFGGPHSDVPLESTGGRLMADLVVDEGLSMVLSTKHFGSRSAERQFAMAFLERLYRRNSELVHLLIDEADLFAPQKPRREDSQLLAVTENIVRRGRNNGIGITMATQRPAVLNKDVLNQVDGLLIMRMLGPHDRDAIDAWVGEHGDVGQGREVKGTLPDLETGETWVWVPELGVLQRTKIRSTHTFDSSPTRRRGAETREPKTYADVDLGSIEQRMAETIERAKAEDPRELRKEIIALRKELATRPTEEVVREVSVEVPTPVFDGEIEQLEEWTTRIEGVLSGLPRFGEELVKAVDAIQQTVSQAKGVADAPAVRPATPRVERSPRPPRAEPRPARPTASLAVSEDFTPNRSQQKILNALAWLASIGLEGDRLRVGFLAGYSPNSGNFQNLLGQMKTAALIEYPRPGAVELTTTGAALAQEPEDAMTTSELHGKVLEKLRNPQRRVLEYLLARYPESCSREEIAEAAAYSASSGNFQNILGSLKTLGLIERPAPGYVRAVDLLFID